MKNVIFLVKSMLFLLKNVGLGWMGKTAQQAQNGGCYFSLSKIIVSLFFRLFEKLFILLQVTDNADEPMEELSF